MELSEAVVGEATISWLVVGQVRVTRLAMQDTESGGEVTSTLFPNVLTTQLSRVELSPCSWRCSCLGCHDDPPVQVGEEGGCGRDVSIKTVRNSPNISK